MPRTEVIIVEAPIGSETETEVRAAVEAEFPGHRVAKIAKKSDVWEIWLQKDAEFPLKGLGPEGDDTGDDNEVDAPKPGSDAGEEKSKPKDDDDPDADDDDLDSDDAPPLGKKPPFGDEEGGDSHEHEGGDPIARMERLLHELKKVIPQLQALTRGDGVPGGDAPLPPPPHPAGPPHDMMPPRRPPVPNGAGPAGPGGGGPGGPGMPPPRPRPGGPGSRFQLPTFTHRNTMRLEREASVPAKEARAEVIEEFPGYKIEEFTRVGDKYVAKLVRL